MKNGQSKLQTVAGGSHQEGPVAETIENQTAKLPSDLFLWGAVGMMAISLVTKLAGSDHKSLFFGQWVAPLLLFGVYNKIVKTQGHDQQDNDYEIDEASY